MSTTPLAEPDELDLILAAQAGDQRAMLALVAQYRPLIASTVGKARKRRAMNAFDAEDLHADLTVALLQAVQRFDPSRQSRLAAVLPQLFAGIVSAIDTTIDISRSTLARYYDLLKQTDGDVNRAAALAPEHGMTADTFWATHAALRPGTPDTAELQPWTAGPQRSIPATEDVELVERALSTLTPHQRAVIEVMYGFQDGDRHGYDWAAAELNITKSAAVKAHTAAMKKMRDALTPAEVPA